MPFTNKLNKTERDNLKKQFDPSRIYMGEVMDTRDFDRDGSILVWATNTNLKRDDKDNWIRVYCASTLYGTTYYKKNSHSNNDDNYEESPTSFGWWNPMPYIGNYVFFFYPCIVGQNVKPFWFACPMSAATMSMIPGIPGQFNSDDAKAKCEFNGDAYLEGKNPFESAGVFKPLQNALEKQGLDKDRMRGISTASSKRETPSMCYGFTSPLGNQFVIDDGWSEKDPKVSWELDNGKYTRELLVDVKNVDSETGKTETKRVLHDKVDWTSDLTDNSNTYKRFNGGFRFRTRNGTQILIMDSGDIYTINADGSVWTEQTHDGYLDCYAERGVNVTSGGDVNVHCGANINLQAKNNLNIKANEIIIESTKDIHLNSSKVLCNGEVQTPIIKSTGGVFGTLNSMGAQLTGVFQGTLQGTAYFATNSSMTPEQQPEPDHSPLMTGKLLDDVKQTENKGGTLYATSNNGNVSYSSVDNGGNKENTITSRTPTHEPWTQHDMNDKIPTLNINPNIADETVQTTSSNTVVTNPACATITDTDTGTEYENIQLSTNYWLKDFCVSDTATACGIKNIPTEEAVSNLRSLCVFVLEPITEHYGKKLKINSGYRCTALNTKVGGSVQSQHCKGQAADIEITGISNYDLAVWISENCDFDQCILEKAEKLSSDPNSGWVHCSYNNGGNRYQTLTINSSGTKYGLSK